jgi:outer membrane protein OmpA-like peptidoglycan-associated protein
MHAIVRLSLLAVVSLIVGFTPLLAGELSTSIMEPTPLPKDGIVTGHFGPGGESAFFLSADLAPGELQTQISFMGRPGPDKTLELSVTDRGGHVVGSHYILGSLDANDEQTRVFQIDSAGAYHLKILTKGPETTSFKLEVGGSALPGLKAAATTAYPFSQSFLHPSEIKAGSAISGTFPGGDRRLTYYYFAAPLKAGELLTQISFDGRANTPKMLELTLLNADGRRNDSHYIMSDLDAKQSATRTFAIDNTGAYVLQLAVKGSEGTRFCVLLGGTALTIPGAKSCPVAQAATPPRPSPPVKPVQQAALPPVKKPADAGKLEPQPPLVEVVQTKCEERLRVGSDFLFEFDKADISVQSDPALDVLAQLMMTRGKPALVEGHTDSLGSHAYNQTLSQLRAQAVAFSLARRGVEISQLRPIGYGEVRAIAPNHTPDGLDNPPGRQRNRRVEVVINTCH